ncbi:MAG: hypothetical protein ACK5TI_01770, partial [bacterium]
MRTARRRWNEHDGSGISCPERSPASAEGPPMPARPLQLRFLPLGALLCACPMHALAQAPAWPAKPIRRLVGYPPGGFTDNRARAVGEPLSRALGQP